MSKDNRNTHNRTAPEVQLISDEKYEETMKRLIDIQIAADAATKALNNLKAAFVAISF